MKLECNKRIKTRFSSHLKMNHVVESVFILVVVDTQRLLNVVLTSIERSEVTMMLVQR